VSIFIIPCGPIFGVPFPLKKSFQKKRKLTEREKPQAFFMHNTIVYGHKNDNFASVHSLFMPEFPSHLDMTKKAGYNMAASYSSCATYTQQYIYEWIKRTTPFAI
jgi:hypothetical protein